MTVLYGPAIHQAAASGDVQQMKAVLEQAQSHLKEWGDVRSALAALKAEIARLEAQKK